MEAKNKSVDLQIIKHNLFKTQNPEIGRFDVIFEVEGKLLYAHKTMLTLVSDTFDSMLSDRWMKNKYEPIKIETYSYDDFCQFLTFLYSGECQLTDTNIFSIVDIAEFYGVAPFKTYCDDFLAAMSFTVDNFFPLMELAHKYSLVQLNDSVLAFITGNFQSIADSDKFMNLEKSIIEKLVAGVQDKVRPEDLFQAVYKWAEKQAMNKKAAEPNLNLNDAIKAEISDFLPHIHFRKMEHQFLCEFVVRKGFIFSSFDDLSAILSENFAQKRVKITNDRGQILHGYVIPDKTVVENIKSLNLSRCCRISKTVYWYTKKFELPTTPSPLKERNGIEWYLFYWSDGVIGVKHRTELQDGYYFLAELIPGPTGFETTEGCKIEIE